MKLLSTTIGKIVAAALILLVIFAVFEVRSCQLAKQRAAQARVDQGQAGAFQNSAADAVNTIGAVNSNQTAAEDLTRRNTEEITHAKGADARLDPELDAAFVRAACRRASAAHDPKCRLQHVDSAGVANRR